MNTSTITVNPFDKMMTKVMWNRVKNQEMT
jgi:hypothetical protein